VCVEFVVVHVRQVEPVGIGELDRPLVCFGVIRRCVKGDGDSLSAEQGQRAHRMPTLTAACSVRVDSVDVVDVQSAPMSKVFFGASVERQRRFDHLDRHGGWGHAPTVQLAGDILGREGESVDNKYAKTRITPSTG